jgi:hypothetical protein
MINHCWIAPGLSRSDKSAINFAFVDARLDTQLEGVANILGTQGYVANFDAVDAKGPFASRGRMLRLGAIIFTLRRKYGVNIVTARGKDMSNCPTAMLKNTYYLVGSLAKAFKKGRPYDFTKLSHDSR